MKYIAEGQLMTKAAAASQKLLGEVFPAEFVTRNVGHVINYPIANRKYCSDYINMVTSDTVQ